MLMLSFYLSDALEDHINKPGIHNYEAYEIFEIKSELKTRLKALKLAKLNIIQVTKKSIVILKSSAKKA